MEDESGHGAEQAGGVLPPPWSTLGPGRAALGRRPLTRDRLGWAALCLSLLGHGALFATGWVPWTSPQARAVMAGGSGSASSTGTGVALSPESLSPSVRLRTGERTLLEPPTQPVTVPPATPPGLLPDDPADAPSHGRHRGNPHPVEAVARNGLAESLRGVRAPAGSPAGSATPGARQASPRADNPAPSYPGLARRKGWQGRVVLTVLVDAQGTALHVGVALSSGRSVLDEAALAAVRNWRFVPALSAGAPVSATIPVTVDFRLED